MTQRFLSAHPRCPLRGHRVYGAKRRCDTPLLSGPPIGGLPYFEFLSDSYPPAPLRPAGKRVTGFSGRFAPLRIQFPCHRRKRVTRFSGRFAPLRIQFPCHLKGTQGRAAPYYLSCPHCPAPIVPPADGVAGVSASFPLPSAKESSAVLSTQKAVKSTGFHSFSMFISPGLSRGPPRGRMP